MEVLLRRLKRLRKVLIPPSQGSGVSAPKSAAGALFAKPAPDTLIIHAPAGSVKADFAPTPRTVPLNEAMNPPERRGTA